MLAKKNLWSYNKKQNKKSIAKTHIYIFTIIIIVVGAGWLVSDKSKLSNLSKPFQSKKEQRYYENTE